MRVRIGRLVGFACLVVTMAATSLVAQRSPAPQVAAQDLLDGLKDPSRWLTSSGDYSGRRNSPLTQITPANVGRLSAQWTFQTDVPGKFEAAPLVLDGIIYVTGVDNNAWAVDARSGRQIWRYRRDIPPGIRPCCGPVNRGFGVLGDKLFMVTLDAHLLALDMKTGTVVWDAVLDDFQKGYAATIAPLVVKENVIVGVAGGEFGVRGFIDAYNAQTGKRTWRFYTVPAPHEPGGNTWPVGAWERGGGSVWQIGSYDPELNTIYYSTGNPSPDYYGGDRVGDNLYTNALVALDPDTGKLRWHYQFTPHDTHDWDAVHTPILADLTIAGQPRKVVMVANRNGFFYTLDRATGKVLVAKPFVETTWAKEVGSDGRPIELPDQRPTEEGTTTCPDPSGATNFMPPSFDPVTNLFFVTAREACSTYFAWKPDYKPGDLFWGGAANRPVEPKDRYGALRAIDPTTGVRRWEFRHQTPAMAGVMSTASGVVFSGDNEGNVMAFDASTGKNLWRYQTGSPLTGLAAVTYLLDGRQFLLIPAGTNLTAFAVPEPSQP